jgi:predicted acetyltransferase
MDIRPITGDDWPAVGRLHAVAFLRPYRADDFDLLRRTFEAERTLAAFDGDAMVASGSTRTLSLTVPGSVVPAAGLTLLAVHPAYRRRGLLSSMMSRKLTEEGEAISVLWAKEASIYRRYGYGVASTRAAIEIQRSEAELVAEAPDTNHLKVELAEPLDARAELASLYDQLRPSRPGYLSRSDADWAYLLHDSEHRRADGSTALQAVLISDDSRVCGYALYDAQPRHDGLVSTATVRLRELHARDGAPHVALWRYLATLDLAAGVASDNLPVDSPLLGFLADPRRARVRHSDGLWLRLVRAGDALAGRRYSAPVDLVVEVDDDRCPWNSGSWRLEGDEAGASCERTTARPDVRLGAAALGAAYLGGGTLAIHEATGAVQERRPGALRLLSAAMSWDPRPWGSYMF